MAARNRAACIGRMLSGSTTRRLDTTNEKGPRNCVDRRRGPTAARVDRRECIGHINACKTEAVTGSDQNADSEIAERLEEKARRVGPSEGVEVELRDRKAAFDPSETARYGGRISDAYRWLVGELDTLRRKPNSQFCYWMVH